MAAKVPRWGGMSGEGCQIANSESHGHPRYDQTMQGSDWIAAGEAARDARLGAEARAVADKLPEAARLLAEHFGAREVVVFGSFAPGGSPGAHSDVDLLVTGVGAMDLLRATGALERLLGRRVDLVPAERARAGVVEAARRDGRRLDGA